MALARKLAAVAALVLLGAGMAACSEQAESDQVGLWYTAGPTEDRKFDHCIKPGTLDDVSWNDEQFWVPTSLRTWNVAPTAGPGVDSTEALVITAKPETGQVSGLEVKVWTQTNLMLNTRCGADERDANSPLVQWWERIGKRYQADQTDGWNAMLGATVVPALEKAKNTLRAYTADQLVTGSAIPEAEKIFAETFSTELTRLSGGNFFCGPDFNRAVDKCSPVAVSIKDVDYKDPGIQEARNEKQKAIERAAAAVAEAEGKVKAAAAQSSLYQNEAWLELEKAKLELEKVRACQGSNCTIIIDASSGGVQVHTGR